MKSLVLLALIITLASCGKKAERVYSVEELLADQQLRAEIFEKCRNNPGELRGTPNCVNAEAANWKASVLDTPSAPGG
ncbi:EexN family lipoprotein [Rhizobium leucaenae]|uniref:EexN family lipoprotein n=1 Tax=Rhizobium leucaenae TaxID=29450 RepID=A0A7W6ZZ36_9HYPH|nr:EexN family lipoprotein [Rhizobium leucaenae]MBB4571432.1 hypothetical protein [Rhizobium leucaenae]MBB6304136.1 hypothetical protein [Rhizobium leucaenae]